MRGELTRELGVSWTPVVKGIAETMKITRECSVKITSSVNGYTLQFLPQMGGPGDHTADMCERDAYHFPDFQKRTFTSVVYRAQ